MNIKMQSIIHPCCYCSLWTHFSHKCKDNKNFKSVSKIFFSEQDQFICSVLCMCVSLAHFSECVESFFLSVLIYAVYFFLILMCSKCNSRQTMKILDFQGTAVTHVLIFFCVSLQQNNKILARSLFVALYVSSNNNTSLHEVLAASNTVQQ